MRHLIIVLFVIFSLAGCNKKTETITETSLPDLSPYPVSATPLPADLHWQTNDTDPEFADPHAKRGGTLREFVLSFPLTLRVVGPDSNGSFAPYMRALNMDLVARHPNTLRPIPALATHWAFGADKRTVYFRLDPDARWSDGKPVTADDYVFVLEFMRSRYIVAPFQNDYFTTQITDIIKFDDYTIAVVSGSPKPEDELLEQVNVNPVPRHFHVLDEQWVRRFNWKPEPGTAAYKVGDIRKGKYVQFERIDNWWANEKRYYRHRFNPDSIRVKVIRDPNIAWQHFEKGELDHFMLSLPDFWHNKAKGKIFDNGYVQKIWFYNNVVQPAQGLWLNMAKPPLDDIRVREAIAYAMDFDKVINTVLHGDYMRMETHNIGYGDYDNKAIKPRGFDIPRAVKLLESAGWTTNGSKDGIRLKNNQRLSLVLSYGNPLHTDRLIILKEEARKAGIELQLQLLDNSAFFKQVLEKNHQIASLGWSGGGLSPEYRQFYHSDNAFKAQPNNITNFVDPEMDKLIDDYRAELDRNKRIEMAHRMEQKVFDSAAMIPTYKVPYFREAYWAWIKLPQDPSLQNHYATRSSDSAVDAMEGGLFWIDVEEKNHIRELMRKEEPLSPPVTIIDETWK